jgi:hypothetical protein
MLTPTLLVTIHGPLKTLDLELPGDVPVGELIPLFLDICGPGKTDPQETLQAPASLQVAGSSTPLPLDKSLIDADVSDGTVLMLQANHLPPIGSQQFVPKTVRPNTKTRGIGVTWESLT